MSNLMTKKRYVGTSPFVRAALDFLDKNYVSYQNFETLQEKIQNARQKKATTFDKGWHQLALDLYEQGLVESAYLHVNARSGNLGNEHTFHIKFKKRETTGLAPNLTIHIKTEKELQDRAAVYRSKRSLETTTRKPRRPSVDKWVRPGGPI